MRLLKPFIIFPEIFIENDSQYRKQSANYTYSIAQYS